MIRAISIPLWLAATARDVSSMWESARSAHTSRHALRGWTCRCDFDRHIVPACSVVGRVLVRILSFLRGISECTEVCRACRVFCWNLQRPITGIALRRANTAESRGLGKSAYLHSRNGRHPRCDRDRKPHISARPDRDTIAWSKHRVAPALVSFQFQESWLQRSAGPIHVRLKNKHGEPISTIFAPEGFAPASRSAARCRHSDPAQLGHATIGRYS